jgi:hypothetical protein
MHLPSATFPDEIIVMILRLIFHVICVTPIYAHIYDDKSIIRRFSRIDRRTRDIAQEIYYGENLVVLERLIFPTDKAIATIRVPSIMNGPWIQRLELRLAIETVKESYGWRGEVLHDKAYLDAKPLPAHLLLRPKDSTSGRTTWQSPLTSLKHMKIVPRFNDDAVCGLGNIWHEIPENFAIDLRLRHLEVEPKWRTHMVEVSWNTMVAYRCKCAKEGLSCPKLFPGVITSMVRLREG